MLRLQELTNRVQRVQLVHVLFVDVRSSGLSSQISPAKAGVFTPESELAVVYNSRSAPHGLSVRDP